jgi:hypothetical protein
MGDGVMKWFKRWIRRRFCRNEVLQGEVLVLWRDVDDKLIGWNACADREEVVLQNIGKVMKYTKQKRLRQIVGYEKK